MVPEVSHKTRAIKGNEQGTLYCNRVSLTSGNVPLNAFPLVVGRIDMLRAIYGRLDKHFF